MAMALRRVAGRAPHAPVAATPPPTIRRKSRLLLSMTNSDEPDLVHTRFVPSLSNAFMK
jgi:hypothetical protein